MIRAVAFDLMDTVLSDPFREALQAATGLELEDLFARRDPSVYPAFERGELDEDAYWAHYRAAGIEVDPERFHRVRRAGIGWLPGMPELLDELEGHVLRVTASNYPRWVEDVAADHLDGRFDRVLASCHLGARKPEPDFYRRLLAEIDLPAPAVLFVDDRQANVEAARAEGLAAHRFTGVVPLRRWLREHGIPAAA